MAWVAVDRSGSEYVYTETPVRDRLREYWMPVISDDADSFVRLPLGSIEKLIGRKMIWDDEPVELKEG
jgi:hypothetical protein